MIFHLGTIVTRQRERVFDISYEMFNTKNNSEDAKEQLIENMRLAKLMVLIADQTRLLSMNSRNLRTLQVQQVIPRY
jgi:hypothetical protein